MKVVSASIKRCLIKRYIHKVIHEKIKFNLVSIKLNFADVKFNFTKLSMDFTNANRLFSMSIYAGYDAYLCQLA